MLLSETSHQLHDKEFPKLRCISAEIGEGKVVVVESLIDTIKGACVRVKHFRTQTKDLVEVFQRAGSRSASVATRSAGPRRARRERRLGPCSTFRRDGEYRKLRLQFLALALRTLGFLLTEDNSLEFVLAFLADVLKDGHEENSTKKIAGFYLKSKCGYFANTR